MTQYRFKEVDGATLQEMFSTHPQGSFAQSVEMGEVRADSGRGIYYVAVYDGATIVAGCQISIISGRIPSADITAGPLIDFSNASLVQFFTVSMKEFLAKQNCVYLTISPNITFSEPEVSTLRKLGWSYSGRIDGPQVGIRGGIRWIYVKDLAGQTEDNYQLAYAKRHRRYIRNHDPRLSIRQLHHDELDIFDTIMKHTAERRQFSGRKDGYFQSLSKRFGDKAIFKVVELQEEDRVIPVAAIVFIESNNEIVSYLGGALSEYAKYRAPYLLYDDMILYSVRHTYARFNFYGIEGVPNGPDSKGYGLYEIKAKFGTGYPVELIGEFILPIQRTRYWFFLFTNRVKTILKH